MNQMRISPEIPPERVLLLWEVLSGAFVTIGFEDDRLFFVSWHGGLQGAFPVLADGTIFQHAKLSNSLDSVRVFLAKNIPGLKINDGKIVWSAETKKPQ